MNSKHSVNLVIQPLYEDKKEYSYRQVLLALDRKCFIGDHPVELDNTFWWLAYNDKKKPIGFSGLKMCSQKENWGLGYLSRAGVLKPYRGMGIQKKMIKARLLMAKKLGLKECVTYVKGFNLASANSLIRCGFKLFNPHCKWGGKSALYFTKKL